MFFRISPCIGVVTPNVEQALEFYRDVMGMEVDDTDDGIELVAGPLHLFLDPGPQGQAVFELLVDDLETAQGKLRFYGFDTLVWSGPERANLVRDPFGLVFNIFEFDEDEPLTAEPETASMYRPVIGYVSPSPRPVAEFYSAILQQPANRLADGSFFISSGEVGMRFRRGEAESQIVWLAHSAPVESLIDAGCMAMEEDSTVIADPYGLTWAIETRPESTHAVVNPL
ncbi:MAG TPA: VOC family protein [Fimbriimonadaceae bacterium]|nr:VOC family protein [Fimbriimonadaceae bacterium]